MTNQLHEPREIAIIGDRAEALILSVLFAEADTKCHLVGPFNNGDSVQTEKSEIGEAQWLLGLHQKSGAIKSSSDVDQIPVSRVGTVILTSHAARREDSNHLETAVRKIASELAEGSSLIYTGLCRPDYTRTNIQFWLEKYSGFKVGRSVGLCYMPLLWNEEPIQAFRERPKILASERTYPTPVQEVLLRVFPSMLSVASFRLAEAAGLLSAVSREVVQALELELAMISENAGLDFSQLLDICRTAGADFLTPSQKLPMTDSIASTILLEDSNTRSVGRLVRMAKKVNEDFQGQVYRMIKHAVSRTGYSMRRSKVAILGLDWLPTASSGNVEFPEVVNALSRKCAKVAIYPGQGKSWNYQGTTSSNLKIESSALKALSNANCALVGLRPSASQGLDARTMASEMTRPGAICDLTGVMIASNVERAGLFYTSIGRGSKDT
ncbi:MAG TPA: hypothetical protein VFE98_10780 [Candidatus Bathyarchaeia archaeon]|nr:hypothetical protein [Candidatus Bathyarchaeia archaeon]